MAYMSATWRGDGVRRFDNMLKALAGNQGKLVMVRALKHTGNKARTVVKRALTKQTGLRSATIQKAIKVKPPNFDHLAYLMETQGGDVALKYFPHRETRKGVSALVAGRRKLYPGSFTHGGRFPNRVALPKLNDFVWERDGKSRLPIDKVRSGVVIPEEMVSGDTEQAFQRSVDQNLAPRVEHEISRILAQA